MSRSKMSLAKTLLGIAAATLLSAGAASAQMEIKLGHVGAPGSLFAQSADLYAAKVNAKLGDKAKVVVYGSSQLGGDGELMKKLKLGTVDLALPSTVMTSVAPEFGVFEMPYLVQNRDHAARIAKDVTHPILGPIAEKAGYRILGVWENGYREITNNKRPIVKPADLEGVKLRVPGGVWRVKMFQAYGASPSPMELKEVFVALQTGVMDGQENPLTQIYSQKFQEVQKYLSLTGHVYTPAYLTAGASWARFPADVQKILADTAVAVEPEILKLAAKLDGELIDKMKSSGIQVNQADKAAFVAASKGVYEDFAKEVPKGKELIDKSLSLAKGS
ncbi:TRAP transporter substrate-binding protein [Pseudolabrys sp. Root1462]|uniref:TRAP transporter substrate-binding protein n=1 Tax=Pseudolabrys sp. Root1462 TaxID=1736466 RepID=UPI000A660E63|nr:TRAP transporter substrate-binding protein [Pseudolabrys sp. Root1462]